MVDQVRILVVDDDAPLLTFLEHALAEFGAEVVTAQRGDEGIQLYREGSFDLAFVDYMMPEMNGVEVLKQIKEIDPDAMVIMMTGNASISSAVEAMKLGAVDYLTKPLDLEHLSVVFQKTVNSKRQTERLRLLENQVVHLGAFEGLVGVSVEMQRLYKMIERVADSEATVLIQGETGTGKELVAKALHCRSEHAKKRFLPINCGALTETILESELFGHEKGAFTGADRSKKGLIEQVAGGTLFLDEIEEMSPALQVKLLRVIQEREVLPVGASEPVKVDFRLVAASNENLRDLMNQGDFRSDLFYRLSVANLELPPLRARREDVPLLAKHFLTIYGRSGKRHVTDISQEAMMVLQAHSWPGNVRELENAIQQAILLTDSDTILLDGLPASVRSASEAGHTPLAFYDMSLNDAVEKFEKGYLLEMLRRANGRVSDAAKLASVNRRRFYAKMSQYNMSRDDLNA